MRVWSYRWGDSSYLTTLLLTCCRCIATECAERNRHFSSTRLDIDGLVSLQNDHATKCILLIVLSQLATIAIGLRLIQRELQLANVYIMGLVDADDL